PDHRPALRLEWGAALEAARLAQECEAGHDLDEQGRGVDRCCERHTAGGGGDDGTPSVRQCVFCLEGEATDKAEVTIKCAVSFTMPCSRAAPEGRGDQRRPRNRRLAVRRPLQLSGKQASDDRAQAADQACGTDALPTTNSPPIGRR